MRIDCHQHFWTYDPQQYAWIDEDLALLRRDFGPADLAPHLDALDMDGCVAVQVRQSVDETRTMLALAEEYDIVRGVVGWADLCAGDVAGQLDGLERESRLVGLRHIVQDEPDDEFLLREDFCRGIAELATLGLTYDILTYPRQLPAAARFVERFPDQSFVLDHLSKPFIARGELEPWATDLRALAAHPRVSVKISGMVTEADHGAWKPEDFLPYLDVALDAFGEERVMFGSDWPVCLLAASYESMADVVVRWAEGLGDEARAKLFGLNAARFYGLR